MNNKLIEQPLRVGFISLGCAKNLVDSEVMIGTLLKDGLELTNDSAQADVVIVNTCSFIDSAQEESVDTILQADQLRDARFTGQSPKVCRKTHQTGRRHYYVQLRLPG